MVSKTNETRQRVYWRTKQNLDMIYLMAFASQKEATFYVHLEDDIVTRVCNKLLIQPRSIPHQQRDFKSVHMLEHLWSFKQEFCMLILLDTLLQYIGYNLQYEKRRWVPRLFWLGAFIMLQTLFLLLTVNFLCLSPKLVWTYPSIVENWGITLAPLLLRLISWKSLPQSI